MADTRIAVRLPPRLYTALLTHARDIDATVSDIVRVAIFEYLQRYRPDLAAKILGGD